MWPGGGGDNQTQNISGETESPLQRHAVQRGSAVLRGRRVASGPGIPWNLVPAAAAKSHQSCPTLCDPIDSSPPGSPRPWDFPGKNPGVGCHFLLQRMKVKSQSEIAQSFLTLSNPMDCSLPGSSVHGIFQARVLEWGAIAFSDLVSSPSQIFAR